jgi:hypothetical protein
MTMWSRFRSWLHGTLRGLSLGTRDGNRAAFPHRGIRRGFVPQYGPRSEAMRQAPVKFGGIEQTKEGCRDARGVNFMTLACDGIYGVVAYLVTQQNHEIGIRVGLGAHSRNIFGLILGRGAKLTAKSVGIGIAATLLNDKP